jgi:hypothetical protein
MSSSIKTVQHFVSCRNTIETYFDEMKPFTTILQGQRISSVTFEKGKNEHELT